MSEPLEPYYREAREFARYLITLIKVGDDNGTDEDGHVIRGQIRQQVRTWESEASPLRTWLLIEVLARSVAATYDDLDEWSAAVIESLATGEAS